MRRFCVQGVVRDGQVVLEIPLDLPDGELVIVTDTPPDDVEYSLAQHNRHPRNSSRK
jgi:hypothetical protein